ncbi:MAG: archaetidylserine decarboxylase [Gammaproteobacteria bacterium]|jgi:phosphatidylserine decarboxylase
MHRLSRREQVNFLLTNRIPRLLATRFIGWYSRIESPLLTRCSIALWRIFDRELNFDEARKRRFTSLRDCFIRELSPGLRPVHADSGIVTSPCDAIVGAHGRIEDGRVYQAKGFPYRLDDLIPDAGLVRRLGNGVFVTLRLKSSMYHRFHAPRDCRVSSVLYQSGDTWNVNPVALKRIEKLFCKNERALVELECGLPGYCLVMVPVAAILVASMHFHCLEHDLDLSYRGPNRLHCDANYRKGEEMGYFQQGSTILLFASKQFELHPSIADGRRIRMGEPLLLEPGRPG